MSTSDRHRRTPQVVLRTAALRFLAVLGLLAPVAAPLRAQEGTAASRVTLEGQVVDRGTGRPLAGAVLEIPRLHVRVSTDREGRFTVRKVRPGDYTVTAARLGYQDYEATVAVTGEGPVRVALSPDPVVLEGLTVKLNVLERRRNRMAVSSRVFDRVQVASSASANMEMFLRGHAGVYPVSCSRGFATDCVFSRGSYVPVAVYLDEMPIFGFSHLASVFTSEVERVEVYQGGRHVRIYTSWFIDQVARGKRMLDPVFF